MSENKISRTETDGRWSLSAIIGQFYDYRYLPNNDHLFFTIAFSEAVRRFVVF